MLITRVSQCSVVRILVQLVLHFVYLFLVGAGDVPCDDRCQGMTAVTCYNDFLY